MSENISVEVEKKINIKVKHSKYKKLKISAYGIKGTGKDGVAIHVFRDAYTESINVTIDELKALKEMIDNFLERYNQLKDGGW